MRVEQYSRVLAVQSTRESLETHPHSQICPRKAKQLRYSFELLPSLWNLDSGTMNRRPAKKDDIYYLISFNGLAVVSEKSILVNNCKPLDIDKTIQMKIGKNVYDAVILEKGMPEKDCNYYLSCSG